MKSMKVWMVALLLITAALVLPVSARTGYDGIESGDTIFLYENHLNLSALGYTTAPYKLIAFEDTDPVDTVTFADFNDFNVPDTMMVGKVYRAYNGANPTAGNTSVSVAKPYVTVDVMLAAGNDKLNEKTITKGTNLQFRLKSNVPSGFDLPDFPPYVELRFTNPDGGSVDTFGTLGSTAGINLTGDEIRTLAADTTDVRSGLWKVQAIWRNTAPAGYPLFNDFYGDGVDSSIVTFTMASGEVKVAVSKDQVIRGNGFTVTITGQGSTTFFLYVKDAGLDDCNQYPFVDPYGPGLQPGVAALTYPDDIHTIEDHFGGAPAHVEGDYCEDTQVRVTLTASGSRTVTFNTDAETKDRTYTFEVYEVGDGDNKDTINVEVMKGTITIDAKGDKIYYSGEEITFMGENTDTDELYLMIVGPNLDECGAPLDDPFDQGLFDATPKLKDDNTWEYKWDTSIVATLDAGSYTVYALSKDRYWDETEEEWIAIDKCNLGDGDEEYDLVTITLKKPFLTASIPSARVAKGDTLTLTGTAEGTPDTIYYWVFGPNLGNEWFDQPISVEDDNTFSEDLRSTEGLQSGQYYIVVQHPMYNGEQDAYLCEDGTAVCQLREVGIPEFYLAGRNRLMGSDAAFAFIDVLNDPRIDDSYVKLTFVLDEPWIAIDPVSDKYIGDKFELKGTTNNAVDDTVLITITSATFTPTSKGAASEFTGTSAAVQVVKGTGDVNTWSKEIDTSIFKPDEYIINVEVVETGATSTGSFLVSEVPPTTIPTTAPPTTVPVTTAVTTAPPTTTVPPTTTPGFGAVIALIGLGAVAVLVLRRH